MLGKGEFILPAPTFENLEARSFEELRIYFRAGTAPVFRGQANRLTTPIAKWLGDTRIAPSPMHTMTYPLYEFHQP